MSNVNFNADELVKIIEACGKSGVNQFKSGETEIKFNGFAIHDEKDYPLQVDKIRPDVQVDPNFDAQQSYEEISDEVEHMIVTDPSAYEEMLFNKETEDSKTHMDDE